MRFPEIYAHSVIAKNKLPLKQQTATFLKVVSELSTFLDSIFNPIILIAFLSV
jgi:hypothetical protein